MTFKKMKDIPVLLIILMALFNSMGAHAEDKEHEWRITKDPFYGDALYHYTRQEYFSAITRLLAGKRMGRLGSHKEEADLLLGGMYLSYGMHNKATDSFDRLLDKKSVKQKIRDRARFYLGKIRYQRGYINKAQESLEAVGNALPANLQEEHAVLLANILMTKGDYKRAINVLENIKHETAWSIYGRYNMGIALIRSGKQERGISLLESVGKMKAKTDEMKALKDKANTALGYNYLKENKPDNALTYLKEVRLDGLLANKALLGTGWAYSAKQEFKKALVYWTELQKRDVIDSAVQESLLAVPYSLANLGAGEQAKQNYREAIAIYEAEQQRLNFAMQAIQSGKLINSIHDLDASNEKGWFYALTTLPKSSESRYLTNLMSSNTFQEALKNYRDVRFLQQYLKKLSTDIGAYDWMVDVRRQAYEQRLPDVYKNFKKLESGSIERRRNAFADEIRRIESKKDIWGLTNSKEREMIHKINNLQRNINKIRKKQSVNEMRNKLRILKGVMAWTLQTEYVKRLWKAKEELRKLDEEIAKSAKAKAAVEKARNEAPATFDGYNLRLQRYKQLIGKLRTRADLLGQEQAKYIEQLAVNGLQQQQQRINTFLTQARFGIVQILDKDVQSQP